MTVLGRSRFIVLALLAARFAAAQDQHAATICPSSPIHCIELVAPPDLSGVSGTIELQPVPSAFGATVTPDGAPRYRLLARVAGLPDAAHFGSSKTYVAWAYTVTMDSGIVLGELHNGTIPLGEIAREQFRVLVTAERSTAVSERSGRIVLRGTSPGARLLAHRDLMQPAAPGVPGGGGHEHGADWPMPPMPAGAMMMPGMSRLTPSVAPWLPRDDGTLKVAVPGQPVVVKNGDTLKLVAELVRRRLAGHTIVMYGFNGQYPGPLIRAKRGATITVDFENRLDQPSSVHWHGVRLDNRFDGVPGITQRAVPAGGSFTYRVHFRDAGIYWYHPHVREDSQQDLGLYGNILVNPERGRWLPPVDREEVLALDDILFDGSGLSPYGEAMPTHALMGRWGNVLLVNGEPSYRLAVTQGEVVRFYLTNVSNARTYNLSFGGGRLKIVASDAGKLERETFATNIVLAPAERYVVDVRFDSTGDVALMNRIQSLDHMYGTYAPEVDTLGIVRVASAAARSGASRDFSTLRANDEVTAELAPYRRAAARPPDRTLVLTLRTQDLPQSLSLMLNGLNVPMEWNDGMAMANWLSTPREVTWIIRDAATGRENMDVRWHFRRGSIAKIRIFNDPTTAHAMDHPIHLHGQRFLILSRNGVPNENLGWKDTALIPAGETVDLLVDMSNPGKWLLHCHVAEHMGAGMMMAFVVE